MDRRSGAKKFKAGEADRGITLAIVMKDRTRRSE
jgi:hypothetical protein